MAASKPWTPGHRRVPPGQVGRFGKAVAAMATIWNYRMMLFANEPEDEDLGQLDDGLKRDEVGKDIVLQLQYLSYRAFPIQLSLMTTEELEAMKSVIDEAFDAARPIVKERDRIAQEAADHGDDTYLRRHRADPRVSRFPGKI